MGTTLRTVAILILCTVGAWGAVQASDPEVRRIQDHLGIVLSELTASNPPGLTKAQRHAREETIGWLAEYREAGIFPHNHVTEGTRISVFVDPHGTPCAVGYLMVRSGEDALVEEIVRTDNLVRVPALAADSRLQDWLRARGITLAEAARIQPAYNGQPGGFGRARSPYAEETVGLAIASVALAAFTEFTDPRDGFEWPGLLNLVTLVGHGGLLLTAAADDADSAAWETVTNVVGAALSAAVATRRFNARSDGDPATRSRANVLPLLRSEGRGVALGVSIVH